MRITLSVLLFLFMNGCAGGQPGPKEQAVPDDTVITLERQSCYGTCPVYKVTVLADGSVAFEGRTHVKTIGEAKSSIRPERLRSLIAAVNSAGYFSLNDAYRSSDDGCPEVWTDMPTVITTIKMNGKSKSIDHDHGCKDGSVTYPRALTEMEEKIDEILNTKQWIK